MFLAWQSREFLFPCTIVLTEVTALKISMLQMYVIRTMGNNQYVATELNGMEKWIHWARVDPLTLCYYRLSLLSSQDLCLAELRDPSNKITWNRSDQNRHTAVFQSLCQRRHNSVFYFTSSMGKCLPANSVFNNKLLMRTATVACVLLFVCMLILNQVQQEGLGKCLVACLCAQVRGRKHSAHSYS